MINTYDRRNQLQESGWILRHVRSTSGAGLKTGQLECLLYGAVLRGEMKEAEEVASWIGSSGLPRGAALKLCRGWARQGQGARATYWANQINHVTETGNSPPALKGQQGAKGAAMGGGGTKGRVAAGTSMDKEKGDPSRKLKDDMAMKNKAKKAKKEMVRQKRHAKEARLKALMGILASQVDQVKRHTTPYYSPSSTTVTDSAQSRSESSSSSSSSPEMIKALERTMKDIESTQLHRLGSRDWTLWISALVWLYGAKGLRRGLKQMRERNISPGVTVHDLALRTLCQAGEIEMAHQHLSSWILHPENSIPSSPTDPEKRGRGKRFRTTRLVLQKRPIFSYITSFTATMKEETLALGHSDSKPPSTPSPGTEDLVSLIQDRHTGLTRAMKRRVRRGLQYIALAHLRLDDVRGWGILVDTMLQLGKNETLSVQQPPEDIAFWSGVVGWAWRKFGSTFAHEFVRRIRQQTVLDDWVLCELVWSLVRESNVGGAIRVIRQWKEGEVRDGGGKEQGPRLSRSRKKEVWDRIAHALVWGGTRIGHSGDQMIIEGLELVDRFRREEGSRAQGSINHSTPHPPFTLQSLEGQAMQEMEGEGGTKGASNPTLALRTTLLWRAGLQGNEERALALHASMRGRYDEHVHKTLMGMYTRHGRVEAAEQLIQWMEDTKQTVGPVAWTGLIGAYAMSGNPHGAEQELQQRYDPRQWSREETSKAWNIVLRGWTQVGKVADVRRVWSKMQDQGISPEERTMYEVQGLMEEESKKVGSISLDDID